MNPQRRFFIEGVHEVGGVVSLDRSDSHKIVHVLRLRSGDTIEAIDSAAQQFEGRLDVGGDRVRAQLLLRRNGAQPASLEVSVAQAIPKGQKMDFVVEKLTELGVHAILPLTSERTIGSVGDDRKLARWQRLAKTAAQQCGRRAVPRIASPLQLEALCDRFSEYDAVLFPWELAQRAPLRDALPGIVGSARRLLIVVGPEGGFSHQEAETARTAGARVVSLGPRILRTETAALFLCSALNYLTDPNDDGTR